MKRKARHRPGMFPSIPRREAYVSCREFVRTPQSVWMTQIRVAPRIARIVDQFAQIRP